jgi:hypothetical protein
MPSSCFNGPAKSRSAILLDNSFGRLSAGVTLVRNGGHLIRYARGR